jgi:hypothetical protein
VEEDGVEDAWERRGRLGEVDWMNGWIDRGTFHDVFHVGAVGGYFKVVLGRSAGVHGGRGGGILRVYEWFCRAVWWW